MAVFLFVVDCKRMGMTQCYILFVCCANVDVVMVNNVVIEENRTWKLSEY